MAAANDEAGALQLPSLDEGRAPTVTDQVYDALYQRVITLVLPPGARLSEADVALQMGVSRQPVRDAFFRLSKQGFIQIRPQRATLVTPISERAIRQAFFIRLALEVACVRKAAAGLTTAQLDALEDVVERQAVAVAADDRNAFHALDDQFHYDICDASGLDFVWTLVKDYKGHMDRARWLSLSYNAGNALHEHRGILAALRARDEEAAVEAITAHLSRIDVLLDYLRREQPDILGA